MTLWTITPLIPDPLLKHGPSLSLFYKMCGLIPTVE